MRLDKHTGWVITALSSNQVHQSQKSSNHGNCVISDKVLKLCPNCDRIYETLTVADKKYNQYYLDFPKYGKKKKTCLFCLKDNIRWVSPHDPGDEQQFTYRIKKEAPRKKKKVSYVQVLKNLKRKER
tara:strand:- start:41 stop:421 length:381 start_codon:yes stop_codon:yes gene_type:complete